MTIRLLQVDTFTDRVLGGNPAAVCPLDAWLDEATMQTIAAENNLSETAFLVPEGEGYRLRWFTPNVEVDLCGHAHPRSRLRRVRGAEAGDGAGFVRDAERKTHGRARGRRSWSWTSRPSRQARRPPPAALAQALGASPAAGARRRGLDRGVRERGPTWRPSAPDHALLTTLDRRGVVATAPGEEGDADYVLRFFAPKNAVPEDPVTGNVQTALVPYWADRLGKQRLSARQLSARGGRMVCEDRGERVSIAGRAVLYMDATISVGR